MADYDRLTVRMFEDDLVRILHARTQMVPPQAVGKAWGVPPEVDVLALHQYVRASLAAAGTDHLDLTMPRRRKPVDPAAG